MSLTWYVYCIVCDVDDDVVVLIIKTAILLSSQGSLLLRLPGGQCLHYQLSGTTDPPSPVDVISRTIPCKTTYTELLSVENWLPKSQRFKVKLKYLEDNQDMVYSLNGAETIDVPASSVRDYQLHIYSYKTGIIQLSVGTRGEVGREVSVHLSVHLMCCR
jgi:hypothetical protein